jgi:hypothetical protein
MVRKQMHGAEVPADVLNLRRGNIEAGSSLS